MDRNHIHPLTTVGMMLSTAGAVVVQYLPTLIGFALTVLGIWLQRRENQRHERAMAALPAAVRPPFLPAEACTDSPP